MRRRLLTATALGGLLAAALTGCGAPAGVDGMLTDDWGAPAEPTVFVPDSGVCHEFDQTPVIQPTGYQPVDCAKTHLLESVHVGALTGEHADRLTPPPPGSPAARAGYAECDRTATEFVGAPWRGARLKLLVTFPTEKAWSSGARWFRCDLAEVEGLDEHEMVKRTGSLASALSGSSPLAHRCFEPREAGKRLMGMRPVACDKPHRAEFVGTRNAPDVAYASLSKRAEELHKGCRGVIARYAGLPDDGTMRYRSGTIYYLPSREEWTAGDRAVRCFLYLDRKIKRSVKDGGAAALPMR